MPWRIVQIVLVVCSLLCVRSIEAQPRRVMGFGSYAGGGVTSETLSAQGVSGALLSSATLETTVIPAVHLPTFEMEFFLDHREEWDLDLSVPITDTLYVASRGLLVWQTDAFFDYNFGRGVARGFVGPGVGFSILSGSGVTGGTFQIPAEIGLEVLPQPHAVSFKLLGRPWFEMGGSDAFGIGGGFVALVGITGYVRK